jgi:hypothetical protein
MVDALFCRTDLYSSYEFQESGGDGFVGPWVTAASGEKYYLCPARILGDKTVDKDFDPSFLDGETDAAYFGDDAEF